MMTAESGAGRENFGGDAATGTAADDDDVGLEAPGRHVRPEASTCFQPEARPCTEQDHASFHLRGAGVADGCPCVGTGVPGAEYQVVQRRVAGLEEVEAAEPPTLEKLADGFRALPPATATRGRQRASASARNASRSKSSLDFLLGGQTTVRQSPCRRRPRSGCDGLLAGFAGVRCQGALPASRGSGRTELPWRARRSPMVACIPPRRAVQAASQPGLEELAAGSSSWQKRRVPTTRVRQGRRSRRRKRHLASKGCTCHRWTLGFSVVAGNSSAVRQLTLNGPFVCVFIICPWPDPESFLNSTAAPCAAALAAFLARGAANWRLAAAGRCRTTGRRRQAPA